LLNNILELVSEYVKSKEKEWKPGEDWVSYSGPVFSSEEYVEAVKTILDGWLVFGRKGRDFELKFSEHLGKKYGVLTNSGSSANLLMLSALTSQDPKIKNLGFRKGTKIITPVTCFPTTLNPILQCGFEPVFVDVTLPDLNLDLDEVERVLQEDGDIRGIMFAHVLGNPPDMDRLVDIIKRYDLVFLEDACDALGSTYDGKKLGSFGLMSTCSFYPAHHMTMGEGGFIATDSNKFRKVLASFRDWGRACYCNMQKPGDVTDGTACGNRFRSWFKDLDIKYDHRYVFDEVGYNLKPLEVQAAIGLKQLEKVDELHDARRRNFNRLNQVFAPFEEYLHLPRATEKSDPSWFAYLLTVKESAPFSRFELTSFLEDAKVQTRSYFSGNILYHPGYSFLANRYDDLKGSFPNAHRATESSFFLGTYAGITEEKLQYIQSKVLEFMEKYK